MSCIPILECSADGCYQIPHSECVLTGCQREIFLDRDGAPGETVHHHQNEETPAQL